MMYTINSVSSELFIASDLTQYEKLIKVSIINHSDKKMRIF